MGEDNLKETIYHNIKTLGIYQPYSKQYQIQEDEILCNICGNPDYEEKNNQMVICSGCNLALHQKCYNIKEIPKDDFFCQLCLDFQEDGKYIPCKYCSCIGGAMICLDNQDSVMRKSLNIKQDNHKEFYFYNSITETYKYSNE